MSPLKLGRRQVAEPEVPERERRIVWRIAALLLEYPNEQIIGMLDDLRAVACGGLEDHATPSPLASLVSFIDSIRVTPQLELAQQYVETFDLRRRSCLHLTYYAYGDTRKRGMALLRFKHAYKGAGAELDDAELPDHLAVVLEFAATTDPAVGRRLLIEHRPAIELLRLSLQDSGSPYASVLDAVCATLPPVNTADRRRIAELAAQGPPDEEVGLEPFAMDPSLQPDTWRPAPPSGGCS